MIWARQLGGTGRSPIRGHLEVRLGRSAAGGWSPRAVEASTWCWPGEAKAITGGPAARSATSLVFARYDPEGHVVGRAGGRGRPEAVHACPWLPGNRSPFGGFGSSRRSDGLRSRRDHATLFTFGGCTSRPDRRLYAATALRKARTGGWDKPHPDSCHRLAAGADGSAHSGGHLRAVTLATRENPVRLDPTPLRIPEVFGGDMSCFATAPDRGSA